MNSQERTKVLIADDDRGLLRDLEIALEGEPFSPFFVHSADEEIKEAKTDQYGLILTDLQMPNEGDGIYAIREIRKFNSKIPIVAHTSCNDKILWETARKAGADEIISKLKTSLLDYGPLIRRYL